MYGVIDIGSNTIRLVIYKCENNKLVPLLNKKCAVGLAGYIGVDNRMKKAGMDKALEALKEFEEILRFTHVREIFPFATASIRNINNTEEVLAYFREHTCFDVQVLTGKEEAMFDYYGASQIISSDGGLMVDIGGGSTELILYKGKEMLFAHSLPIGSLNQYNNHVAKIIPSKKEIMDIQKCTKQKLVGLDLPEDMSKSDIICGIGGTARAILKVLENKEKDIDPELYEIDYINELVALAMGDASKLAKHILKHAPDRIHTFIPGLVIMQTVAEHFGGKAMITSHYGVREGYLHHILEKRGVFHESEK